MRTLILILITLMLFYGCSSGKISPVPCENPSFESVTENNIPMGWGTSAWRTESNITTFSADSFTAADGRWSAKIQSFSLNHARFQQYVQTLPNTTYHITAMAKAFNVGTEKIGVCLGVEGQGTTSRDLRGSTLAWEKLELYVKTDANTRQFLLYLNLGSYSNENMGVAYFDNIQIETVPNKTSYSPLLVLHQAQQQQPQQNSSKTTTQTQSFFNSNTLLIVFGILLVAILLSAMFFFVYQNEKKQKNKPVEPDDDT